MQLAPEYVRQFRANAAAWAYFQGRPPGYRRLCIYRVMSAKRPETQTPPAEGADRVIRRGPEYRELERPSEQARDAKHKK